jgi:hypothetical protein
MEGQREIGLRLLMDIMGACPDNYVLMMRESNERQSVHDARYSRGHSQDGYGRDKVPDSDDDSDGGDSTDIDDGRIEAESR